MQELNGQTAYNQLEIKRNADHAGHTHQLHSFRIDSVLPQMNKLRFNYLLKIQFPATTQIPDAMEVGCPQLLII
jgi:hypothetical protein